MTFALTILETALARNAMYQKYANKVITPTYTTPYDLAKWWNAYPREFTSLAEMASMLEYLADRPRVMIIRGQLLPPVQDGRSVMRRYADPEHNYFEAVARGWIVFDFDGTPVPTGLDAGDQVEAAGLYLRTLLPPEFRNVRAIASVTGSTGRAPGCARLRLFFLLEDRISDEDLTLWMKGVNWVWKLNLDASILGTVQAVYTARPFFRGGAVDPVPRDRRVSLLPGATDYVDIDLEFYSAMAEQQLKKENRAVKRSGDGNGADWRAIIDNKLGGVDNWHDVIWRALGVGIAVGEADEVMVDYIVAFVGAHGDRDRVNRYDTRYCRDRIKAFKRREKRRAEDDAEFWRPKSKEEIEAIIRFVEALS
jgi:hypothetical protein